MKEILSLDRRRKMYLPKRTLGWIANISILLLAAPIWAQQTGTEPLKSLGYPADAKLLILHADDLGMSHSVNQVSFEALDRGYFSSASVMVPCPWFTEVANYARSRPESDLGRHLTFTSEWKTYRWRPVPQTPVGTLTDDLGCLPATSLEVGQRARPSEVTGELQAQINKARRAGIAFTHLDNHMGGLSQSSALFQVYLSIAREAGVLNYVNPGELKAYGPAVSASDFDIPVPSTVEVDGTGSEINQYLRAFRTLQPGLYVIIVDLGKNDIELRAIMGSGREGATS